MSVGCERSMAYIFSVFLQAKMIHKIWTNENEVCAIVDQRARFCWKIICQTVYLAVPN